jgi:SAM-dependent methyltransferase
LLVGDHASVPVAQAPPASPYRTLAELLIGGQVQQAIHVAARLGVADLLAEGDARADELAPAVGADPNALYRLLRALAGIGLVEEDEDGRFGLTPLGAPLRADDPGSVRPFALWAGAVSYQAFGGLAETVRTGEPAFERIFGQEFFDYLGTHSEAGSVFDAMMARHTAPVARDLVEREVLTTGTVVDLGGGDGALLARLLRSRPRLRGILVDQRRVLDRARAAMVAAGVADRCEVVAQDVTVSVPRGDAYLLKSVLHGFADEVAERVLGNCRRAMRHGGKVVLVEVVIPPGNDPHPGKLMDLLMLVGCHGRERTEQEFDRLLARAGLRLVGITPTKLGYAVIEAAAQPSD